LKLEVNKGFFSYGSHSVLKDINMAVETGDVFAILGKNGAGKTSLLKCIMNMLRWDSGASYLDGEDTSKIPYKIFWRNVAYVPQARQRSDCTVRDMVILGRSSHLGLFEKPGPADYEIADEVMNSLGIQDIGGKSCSQISGGEMQLVLIGRALAAKPKLLILDEPESNLDYHNQLWILNLITSLSKTTTCVLNTHYPEHALRYANKSLLIGADGHAVSGNTEQIITPDTLEKAFGINAVIGSRMILDTEYKYIIPVALNTDH
jgi:iron complex transport system ATP-binding protein